MNLRTGVARRQPLQGALAQRPAFITRFFQHDDRSVAYAAVTGALVVSCLAMPLAIGLNAWIDEAFTLHSTARGIAYAVQAANTFELQPPLYFALEAAWRTFDEGSIPFARIPSICFGAIAVAVLVFAARRIAPGVPPFAVAAVTAFNPLVLWAACEMRVYALLLCIAAVLTWAYFSGFLAARRSRQAQIFYVVFAVAGLYTQYYVGFMLLAQGLTIVLLRRAAMREFCIATAVITAAFGPFVPTVIAQTAVGSVFLVNEPFRRVVHDVAVNVFVYALPHDLGARGAAKVLTVALTGFLSVLVLIGRPSFATFSERDFTVAWALCVVAFCALFAASGVPDVRRHLIGTAPWTILVSLLAVGSRQRQIRWAGATAFAIYGLLSASALWAEYAPPTAKDGDWQRVAAAVGSTIPVAVFPAELGVPLALYRSAPSIPIPRPMPFSGNYSVATRVRNVADVARAVDPTRARQSALWLVTSGPCVPETPGRPWYHCRYVKQYFSQHYRLVRRVGFKGTLVELYERRDVPGIRSQMPANHS